MARRPSPLADAITRTPARTPEPPKPRKQYSPHRPPSRQGMAFLGGYVDRMAKKQLKILLAELEMTEQAAVEAMLNDFFERHGKHRIASRDR